MTTFAPIQTSFPINTFSYSTNLLLSNIENPI
jgi:hypothetical protein